MWEWQAVDTPGVTGTGSPDVKESKSNGKYLLKSRPFYSKINYDNIHLHLERYQ